MSKLWQIIIKLVFSIGLGIAVLKGTGDLSGHFNEYVSEYGLFIGTLETILGTAVIIGFIYTVLSVFWFCFTCNDSILIICFIPIPFASQIISGVLGLVAWGLLLDFLEKRFATTSWFTAFEVFVYLPMCLWIDIIALILEKKNTR